MVEKLLNLLWEWLCAAKIAELEQDFDTKLGALETSFAAMLQEAQDAIRKETQTRLQVLDDDLSSVEHRLVSRIEPLEDAVNNAGVIQEREEGDADSGGFTKWSVRKQKVVEANSDPTVFTDPSKYKYRPKPTPAVEPEAQKEQ